MDITLDSIETTTATALVGHGASESVAASVAAAVRSAEGNGNRICGLYYVESYCLQLRSGRVDGRAEPTVTVDRPGVVRVDGRLGFAQPAFDAGFDQAVAAARTQGVAALSIEHTHTATAVGYFTERLARAGLISFGCTNASPRVAPPGGSTPLLGTNPLALAVPDGQGGIAFGFDFSTSAVALGRITMAAAAGEKIPLGWAIDDDGKPTTDPHAALTGSMLSTGGYKGFGLGLMVEVLAAGLTGGRASVDVPPLKATEGPPHDLGQFYLLVDPDAFTGERLHRLTDQLHMIVDAQPEARLPGSNRQRRDPVDVPDDLWDRMIELSRG